MLICSINSEKGREHAAHARGLALVSTIRHSYPGDYRVAKLIIGDLCSHLQGLQAIIYSHSNGM